MEIRHFVAHPPEPAEVTALRQRQAAELRTWIGEHVDNPEISDVDFAYSLHLFTYDQAMNLCALALEIHNEGQA